MDRHNMTPRKVFYTNIEEDTTNNDNYRMVLYTTPRFQLVVMSLQPLEEIGFEKHDNGDQFIRVERGYGQATIYYPKSKTFKEYKLEDGDSITISAGTFHNIENLSDEEDLKLYTIYTPPQHKPNTLEIYKE